MSPIDPLESLIVARLDPIFHDYHMTGSDGCEVVELLLIDAIGPRADHKTYDRRMRKRLPIECLKLLQGSVGV